MPIIIYLVLIMIYCALPLPGMLVAMIINTFVPDPIPILDEVIMVVAFFKKLAFIEGILEIIDEYIDWVKEHKFIGSITTGGIIWVLYHVIRWLFDLVMSWIG